MSVLLITYDLNKPGQDYEDVHKYIKQFSWARISESSYAIETNLTPDQIYQGISKFIDKTDRVYIITLDAPYSGQGPQEVNQWLSEHLNAVKLNPIYRW
jgi:hypothetical protein